MDQKYKFKFNDQKMQDSLTYVLFTKFGLEPNILKAEIDDTGGTMIIRLKGDEKNIENAVAYMRSQSVEVDQLYKHIIRDHDKCIDCGACVSICPAKAFTMDPVTFEIHLDADRCVACASCLTACSAHAVKLTI